MLNLPCGGTHLGFLIAHKNLRLGFNQIYNSAHFFWGHIPYNSLLKLCPEVVAFQSTQKHIL